MNQPPYNRQDLEGPAMDAQEFVAFLGRERTRKYPEQPPFFQELGEGTLTPVSLDLWAKNQYTYWESDLPFSTGAILCKTHDEGVRAHMLKKLVCIEGREIVNDLNDAWTAPAYEELWLRFGESLGLSREEMTGWNVFSRTHFATSTLRLLSRWWEWSWLDGVAAMYAADLLARDDYGGAIEPLARYHGVSSEGLGFFEAYASDGTEDIAWEEEALAEWCFTRERQLTAARAFRYRLDIEYQAHLPLHTAASGKLPLQVP